MRRAQFEILGMAIVVVIVSVAIFFVLAISVQPPEEDTLTQFSDEQFAQNLLDALVKTHMQGCPQFTVADYIAAYIQDDYPTSTGSCKDDAGMDEVTDLVRSTVQLYKGRPFHFEIRNQPCQSAFGGGCEQRVVVSEGCDPTRMQTGRAGRTLPSLWPQGHAEVVLWICKPR